MRTATTPAQHRSKKTRPRGDTDALPGVQKLKSALRQTRRLLAKDKITPDVRVETERRLKALEADIARSELARKERGWAVRYHKVRFFERQKVVRKIQQAAKRPPPHSNPELFELRVDLNYILHYPKTKKYVSLFAPPSPSSSTQTTDAQREEVRAWVRGRMERGELPMEPERYLESGKVARAPPPAAGTVKVSSKLAKVGEDVTMDDFFEDDDEDANSDDSERG